MTKYIITSVTLACGMVIPVKAIWDTSDAMAAHELNCPKCATERARRGAPLVTLEPAP